MIELTSVTRTFNQGKQNEFTAVNDVSLTIRQGELTVLKGPSGSGKTTLLALIGCMARPTSGKITLRGVTTSFFAPAESTEALDITSLPERFLTEIRRHSFGFIFQQFNLVKGISTVENIMLPAYTTGEHHHHFRQRALGLMEKFSITRHAASPVECLSGGEMQRVAIARALINSPTIIVADEPTSHLDSALSREFMASIELLQGEGRTILIASHDPLVHDAACINTVVSMRDGRITDSITRA